MYLIKKTKRGGGKVLEGKIIPSVHINFNPIPNDHGRNQPIYECHVTTAGRNRVKVIRKVSSYVHVNISI